VTTPALQSFSLSKVCLIVNGEHSRIYPFWLHRYSCRVEQSDLPRLPGYTNQSMGQSPNEQGNANSHREKQRLDQVDWVPQEDSQFEVDFAEEYSSQGAGVV
jgi:hypothetical protein